jgi:phosphate transport system permease protein
VNTRARVANTVAITIVRALALLLVALLVYIVVYLIVHGFSELRRLDFYTKPPNPTGPGGGIGPQLYNTVYVLLLSMVLTVPLGLFAGIYFAEYAGTGKLNNAIRRATETLATLPSIVVGLFGFSLFVQATGSKPSRFAAALCLVVINLPYAVRVTEDALRNLPASLREGSMALGATRWETIRRVLVPAALPGLITGIVLIAGRAFGEAAAILFAGAAGAITTSNNYNLNPFTAGDTLAVNLYQFRIQIDPGVVTDATRYSDGIAALLLILVLLFNLSARGLGRYTVRRLQGV